MIIKNGDDGSENDANYSSSSFRSTSTSKRNAKNKTRKIREVVADYQAKANSDPSDDIHSQIHGRMEEQKSAVPEKQQKREDRPFDCSTASVMMLSLSEEIGAMELEAQKLMEELERTKQETSKPKQRKQNSMKEGFDQEFLESRIAELEVENEILTTRLQSGQATVDSIRTDISSMESSNEEYKRALREAKDASRPLQVEHEKLCSELQKADEDLQALQATAGYKQVAKQVEKDQKEIFEQAAREILDLQRNHRLKKQISQRKLQQKQQQKQRQPQMQQVQEQNSPPQQTQTKPFERTIQKQNSWWQLDTTEKAGKKAGNNIHRTLSEDTDLIESECSDIDTVN